MRFHVMTLFPEMIVQGVSTSITGRAIEQNLISVNAVNIRDFSKDKHHKVDDYTYGGGAGMLLQAQPVYDAWESITGGKRVRCVYMTPQGRTFSQSMAKELAKEEEVIFLCGHYEGIDERVLDEIVTDRVSIGDYVLTGGELPAMVMIDAISRLVPGVLNNEDSAQTESFHNDLLEYPQYSRPEEWHGKSVPEVLLSGNHKNICAWRLDESKKRTEAIRPDLYEKYLQKEKLIKQLSKSKRNHIHMMESLARGLASVIYAKGKNILLYNDDCKVGYLTAENEESAKELLGYIPEEAERLYTCGELEEQVVCEKGKFKSYQKLCLCLYTQKLSLPVKHKDIRTIEDGSDSFGAFEGEHRIARVAVQADGGICLTYEKGAEADVEVLKSLLASASNRLVRNGYTPYLYYLPEDSTIETVQKELGFYVADKKVTCFS